MSDMLDTTQMPIPPLDPSWYRDPNSFYPSELNNWDFHPMHREVIFKMTEFDYMRRMRAEAQRLEREAHLERMLSEKTRIIKSLQEQIQQLQTFKQPNVAALREAYAKDIITLEEFDRLVMYAIAGQE